MSPVFAPQALQEGAKGGSHATVVAFVPKVAAGAATHYRLRDSPIQGSDDDHTPAF